MVHVLLLGAKSGYMDTSPRALFLFRAYCRGEARRRGKSFTYTVHDTCSTHERSFRKAGGLVRDEVHAARMSRGIVSFNCRHCAYHIPRPNDDFLRRNLDQSRKPMTRIERCHNVRLELSSLFICSNVSFIAGSWLVSTASHVLLAEPHLTAVIFHPVATPPGSVLFQIWNQAPDKMHGVAR
nr:hypothetical protein CFP56_01221 [Quercus suber]